MALKEELYLSVNKENYRNNKSRILETQADLLRTMKKIQNLRVFARQKNDLKKRLQKLLTTTQNEITAIQDKLPTAELPKTIKPLKEKIKIEKEISRQNSIDEELKTIQEKLKQLNAH